MTWSTVELFYCDLASNMPSILCCKSVNLLLVNCVCLSFLYTWYTVYLRVIYKCDTHRRWRGIQTVKEMTNIDEQHQKRNRSVIRMGKEVMKIDEQQLEVVEGASAILHVLWLYNFLSRLNTLQLLRLLTVSLLTCCKSDVIDCRTLLLWFG